MTTAEAQAQLRKFLDIKVVEALEAIYPNKLPAVLTEINLTDIAHRVGQQAIISDLRAIAEASGRTT